MYVLCAHITIINSTQTYEFKFVNSCTIMSNIDQLTDTCTILLPRKLKYRDRLLYEFLSAGDQINVELGYNNQLEQVFSGYIRNIRTYKIPAELYCEDNMYLLKKIMIDAYQSDNMDVKDFIEQYLPANIERNVESAKIGRFRLSNKSLAEALDIIKKEYPMNFFFKDGKFYGTMPETLANQDANGQRIIFKYRQNFIEDNITQDDIDPGKIQIIAKTFLPDGTKLETKYPDKIMQDANVRTFVTEKPDMASLKEYAKQQCIDFKISQISGSFKAFGWPVVRIMDVVEFRDDENTYRDKKAFTVKLVKRNFNMSGYRQEIEILNQV